MTSSRLFSIVVVLLLALSVVFASSSTPNSPKANPPNINLNYGGPLKMQFLGWVYRGVWVQLNDNVFRLDFENENQQNVWIVNFNTGYEYFLQFFNGTVYCNYINWQPQPGVFFNFNQAVDKGQTNFGGLPAEEWKGVDLYNLGGDLNATLWLTVPGSQNNETTVLEWQSTEYFFFKLFVTNDLSRAPNSPKEFQVPADIQCNSDFSSSSSSFLEEKLPFLRREFTGRRPTTTFSSSSSSKESSLLPPPPPFMEMFTRFALRLLENTRGVGVETSHS